MLPVYFTSRVFSGTLGVVQNRSRKEMRNDRLCWMFVCWDAEA